MSIRFNADADRLVRTNNLPTWDNYTVAGFVQLVNDTGNPGAFSSLEEDGSSWHVFETAPAPNSTRPHLYAGFSVDLDSTVTMTVGTWYFLFLVHTATTITIGICEVGSSSFTFASTGDTAARVFSKLVLMGDSFNEPPDVRALGWRVWNASDFTNGDILAESQSLGPVRTANLDAYYRWLNAEERLTDYGPNGYNLSEVGGGAWETEENPPGIGAVDADLTSMLPGLTSSMLADVGVAAGLAAVLPGLTSSMDAAVGVAGSLAGMLPGLSGAMSVSPGVAVDLASTLPGLTSAMSAQVSPVAALASTLPGITSAMSLGHGPAAALASILPGLISAMGLVTTRHPSATMAVVDGPTASMGVV